MLKQQVQIVAYKTSYSFAKCANQVIYIKALMLSYEMLVLQITINFSDLKSILVLIFIDIRYKNNSVNNFRKAFARMTTIINLIAIACCFETTCYNIFMHLLAANSKNKGLFNPISIYFGTIKTNKQGILHLYY